MTAGSIAATPARVRPRRRPMPLWSPTLTALLAVVVCAVVLQISRPEVRAVLAPVLVMALLSAFFAWRLFLRDGRLPLFEAGSLAVLATFMYGAVPMLNYIAGGLQWIPYSDSRLLSYGWTSPGIEMFGWRFVVYLGALVAAYLLVRGRATATSRELRVVAPTDAIAMLLWVLAVHLAVWGVEWFYGVSLTPSHEDIYAHGVKTIWDLPLFVNQIMHNLMGTAVVVKYWLAALLLRRWRRFEYRLMLIAWMALEVALTVGKFGARGELVLLLLATTLLYHRLVAPLRLRLVLPVSALFLTAFLAYGFVRDMGIGVGQFRQSEYPLLAYPNEFQAVLGTAYDLHMRQEYGILPPVPWQIYFADFYMVIPSQVLPFTKIEPGVWYLTVAGIQGAGFMFGLMSQAVLGYDWIELAVRGLVLGIVLALIHRWYVRRQESFWVTMTYLFLCLWAFYTVRQSTFSPIYFFVYRFVTAVVIVRVISGVLSTPRRVAGTVSRFR